MHRDRRIAVVIPSFGVRQQILQVIEGIGPEVTRIYVVDDHCPQHSGLLVETHCRDRRVRVLRHAHNQGVGGAVMTGYAAAIADGMEIIVKVDGDGQMDAALIPELVAPILSGHADYTKGNRFFDLEEIRAMPNLRLFGNAVLSLVSKLSSGYWNLFDPTNGFTAIHREAARRLPVRKISRRYFFESDLLFRLNTLGAVVVDIPMAARYGEEVSNLRISRIVHEFVFKHLRNFGKRVFYNYYLRGMSMGSIELPLGIALLGFGGIHGLAHWLSGIEAQGTTPAGTVMLAGLPVILGMQLILAFIGQDIASVPTRPLHRRFKGGAGLPTPEALQA